MPSCLEQHEDGRSRQQVSRVLSCPLEYQMLPEEYQLGFGRVEE